MRLEGIIRKVITFYPVWSPDNSRSLCGPTVDEAITRIASEDGLVIGGTHADSGGIPSLAPKKKTHGDSALLLIACSVSMFRLARLSAGQSAVAGAKCRTRRTD